HDGSRFGGLEPAMLEDLVSDSRTQKSAKQQRVPWFQSITIELYPLELELGALARKLFSSHPPTVSRQSMGFPTKTRCQLPRKRAERMQALRHGRQLHLVPPCAAALPGSASIGIGARPTRCRLQTFADPSSNSAKVQQ